MADAAGTIAQNLADIRGSIAAAAQVRTIELVCVTKYAREEWIAPLLAAGATDLGENHLPTAAQRFDAWRTQYGPFKRHLLGAQQSRKVKLIPAACDLFQALDRQETAALLEQTLSNAGESLDVLLQVNVDAEPQKHGYAEDTLEGELQFLLQNCPHVQLRGLMAIPRARQPQESAAAHERRTRASYSTMARLFAKLAPLLPASARWDTLSMGMSQDFTWAIEEGATMVRVGGALFAGLEG